MRCVVGVYVISPPIGSSAPAGIVMTEPRDEPETDPESVLYGIVFAFCRCFGLPLVFPEASVGDLDGDPRRRDALEDVRFSSEGDERPMGREVEVIAVD